MSALPRGVTQVLWKNKTKSKEKQVKFRVRVNKKVNGEPFKIDQLCDSLEEAKASAQPRVALHVAVVIDEMATDDSRSTGVGNEFYITGFDGPDAALALAGEARWAARWLRGFEQSFDE